MESDSENCLRRGKLVVFEGIDASGKSTQVKMLLRALNSRTTPHDFFSFPRTDERGYGEAIAMFLRGEFGTVESVHPYLIAALFAGDRLEAKRHIDRSLAFGKLVVIDRYVYSNLAFQAAKLRDPTARDRFREWISYIEWECNKLPVPDLTVFFDVPFEFVRRNLDARRGEDRSYLNGMTDIHESATDLQAMVAAEYHTLSVREKAFCTITCMGANGAMRSPAEIHQDVLTLLIDSQILKTQAESCL